MKFAEWLRRLRGSRGYGIHSPLAFRLVKNVIRPRNEAIYYGEEKLMFSSYSPSIIRRARILLRFVAELQPSYVWMSPGIPEIYKDAVKYAGCVVRIYDGEIFPREIVHSDMVVSSGVSIKKNDLKKVLDNGKSFIGFDLSKPAIVKVSDSLGGGVILDGVDSIIAVASPSDALHKYEISRF